MPLLTVEDQERIALYGVVERAALRQQPRSYLEIGCREGDSLIRVLHAAPMISLAVVCDIWDANYGGTGRGSPAHVERQLHELGLYRDRFVIFITGRSQEVLPMVNAQFDMILVDGDHSLEGARDDLGNAWRLLAPGGTLVMDDISNPEHSYLGQLFWEFAELHRAEVVEEVRVGVGAATMRKVR